MSFRYAIKVYGAFEVVKVLVKKQPFGKDCYLLKSLFFMDKKTMASRRGRTSIPPVFIYFIAKTVIYMSILFDGGYKTRL